MNKAKLPILMFCLMAVSLLLFWHHSFASGTTYFVCDCQSGADGACVIVDNGHPTLSNVVDFVGASRDSFPEIGAFE